MNDMMQMEEDDVVYLKVLS